MGMGLGRIVEELAPVRETVGRDVEDPHDLALIEPHRAGTQLQRRAGGGKRSPLRLGLHCQRIGQPRQNIAHIGHGNPAALDNLPAAPDNQRKAAGINHPAGQPHRFAILALGRFSQGNRAQVECVGQGSVASR